MKNIAIITGATGGFGQEFCSLLNSEKNIDEIWAISRSKENLDSLEKKFGNKIISIPLDLTDRNSFNIIEEKLSNENPNILFLINNAGYGKFAAYDELSVKDSLNMIDLNINSVVALTVICIKFMSNGSRILNISSQSAFFPLPYLNIYSATKVFVKNYTRALNIELKNKKISATAVCPGWMKTDFLQKGNIGSKKNITNFFGITTPEKVARKAFKDAKKGKDMSFYGFYVNLSHILSKILPQKFFIKIWENQQKF